MPQSTAATRVIGLLRPSRSRAAHARPVAHHSRQQRRSPRRPSGLTPGPGGERVADEHVQALHPVRHAAGAEPAISGTSPIGVAAGEVVLVRGRGSAAASSGSVASRAGHLAHHAGRLERADRGGGPRAGQVVEGRERRAVRQPRRGLDDVGLPAGAAVRDRAQPRGGRPSCALDDRVVAVRRAVERRRRRLTLRPGRSAVGTARPPAGCVPGRVPAAAGSAVGRCVGAGSLGLASPVDDDVAGLARQQ